MSIISARPTHRPSRRRAILAQAPRPPMRLSTFEKVIAANSAIIILATLTGWWVTQHNPEAYHYLIDTTFIALAALLAVAVNFAVLRAAFAPLHSVLATIRAVERGDLAARAEARESDADALELARAINGMLDRLEALRDESAARVLRAQEGERRRLALELHDQTGQSLTALALHAEVIARGLAGEESAAAMRARQRAERLGILAQQTLGEVQAIARQLRPTLLDDLGLAAALRWLAEDASARLDLSVAARIAPPSGEDDTRLPEEIETALFRIAQEAITNAVRHGQAARAWIVLRVSRDTVTLMVADDGRGFDPATHRAEAPTSGIGLGGMRERARLLGGSLAVRSRPGRGCAVRARVPRSRARDGRDGRERRDT